MASKWPEARWGVSRRSFPPTALMRDWPWCHLDLGLSLERWENTLLLCKPPGSWYFIKAVLGNQTPGTSLTVPRTILHIIHFVTTLLVSLRVQEQHIQCVSALECLHQLSLPTHHSFHRYTNSSHPHCARSLVHIPFSVQPYLTTQM